MPVVIDQMPEPEAEPAGFIHSAAEPASHNRVNRILFFPLILAK